MYIIDPSQMYVFYPSPGKGLGVFASRNISQGSRIMEEAPLLYLQPGLTTAFAYKAYMRLSEEDQETFSKLSCTVDNAKIEIYEQDIQESGLMDPNHPDPDEFAAEGSMVMAIFENNNFNLGSSSNIGYAVFPDASRLNHSCRPNASQTWNGKLGKNVVHALRDLGAGEEIFISYIPTFTASSHRQAMLRERWEFSCVCPACDMRYPQGVKSAQNRITLSDKWTSLQQYLMQGTEEIIIMTLAHEKSGLLAISKEEGILGWERGVLFRELAAIYEQRIDLETAVMCQDEATYIATYCFGEDDPLVRELTDELDLFRGMQNGTIVLHVE